MKIYSYRGSLCVLVPDAQQNTPENAVVRKVQKDPAQPNGYLLISGATDLAFRHELKDTGEEFTP